MHLDARMLERGEMAAVQQSLIQNTHRCLNEIDMVTIHQPVDSAAV